MTKLKLTNENGTYSVSVPEEMMNMKDLINTVVVPVLQAAGYGEPTILEFIDAEILR